MTARRRRVRVAANFRRNLERIAAFLDEAGAPQEFEAILARLGDEIVPTLERFPEIGAGFLDRSPLSADGKALFAKVVGLLDPGDSLRQFVVGDYILLYLVRTECVDLLSIRHHRELSFDFAGHWP